LITGITAAQGPGPKGDPFIPATPALTTQSSDQHTTFRRAAERLLAEYLQSHRLQHSLTALHFSVQNGVWRLQPELARPALLSPEDARRAALEQMRLQREAGHAPLWDSAALQDPILLYDLTGEVTAYLFPVTSVGKPAGYLTVAAIALPNPVLEFAVEGSHPLSDAVSHMATLGMRPLHLEHPLYLGLLAYGYEVASSVQGQRAVFDLVNGRVLQVSEADARIPLRQRVAAYQEQAVTTEPSPIQPSASIAAYSLISGVPDWNQFWGSYGCWSGCSPTAATNVMGYWDNHGYGNLIYGSDWQGAVNEMRNHMGTQCGQDGGGWTNVGNISSGMSAYAQSHGYTFVSELWCSGCATSPTYDNYRGQINASRPLVVDVIGHSTYGSHSVTGVGYDTNGSYMIVHDNWSSTGENVYLQYGSGYSSIFMHPLIPGGSGSDTTPPSGDYTSPANGATDGSPGHQAARARDNQSGVREVHFTAKWSGQWHLVYNDTSAPYEYDWDLCASGVPDGDIELGLDIWDNAGNEFHLHTVHPNPHITKSYNCSAPGSTWSVDYWNNKYLAGYPNWHNNESGTYIFRDWGDGGPGGGIQVNEWSARFVRTVYFPGGDYRFHCQHDDGCRIYIDGQNPIDAWWDSSFDGHDWGGYLSPGNHEVKVEYYDNQGGARLEAWWQGPGFLPRDQTCDPNQWCAEYWGNRNLSGTPAIHRNEGETIWHDWGSGGPDPTFPADNFSSRFVRNATFTCGTYRFHILTDDGVRFWVDNVLRLDQWRDQVASYDVDLSLSSGTHSLKVEHYENGGGAAIRLWWEKLANCQPAVAVDYASTHYVRPGVSVDPTVRVRVTAGYLDGGRGDTLTFVGGAALGASTAQPLYGTVNEGSTYTFDVVNNSTFRMTAPSAEGTYDSRWRVKAAGNLIGPEATVRVVVDGTSPTIAIQNPAQGAYLNANAVTVQAAPQDAGGIDQVQFFVGYDNGGGWAWYNLGWDLDGSDGWKATWNATGVPDQTGVAFYAYAWDRAGNGAGTAVWDVTLDRTPPTTAIRPLAATQDSTAFIVWWDASDNAAGVDHLDLQKRQDDGAWEDWHLGVGSQYVGAWFIGEMGHRYGFRMRGVDQAGNTEAYPGNAEAETYINVCSGDGYEADNGPTQARTISPGQSQPHNFGGTNEEDWVKFWARAGKRYILETGSLGFTTDTVLTLYDSDGTTVLVENDDIAYPDNLASRVEWKAQRDGWLYARVRHWNGRIAGNAVTYTLRLEEGYRVYLPLTIRNR
jgi:uncharacterized protein YneR